MEFPLLDTPRLCGKETGTHLVVGSGCGLLLFREGRTGKSLVFLSGMAAPLPSVLRPAPGTRLLTRDCTKRCDRISHPMQACGLPSDPIGEK